MPVEYGPHQDGDRLPGHDIETWPEWKCTECPGSHESDPRQGCPGFKRTTKQPTLEQMQGGQVHGEINDGRPAPAWTKRSEGVPKTPSLADRLAQGTTSSANPVLLDSIRMIVREELQQKSGNFTDREKLAIVQGLKVVMSILAKGRLPEDDVLPSDEELQALIERLEQ